MNKFFEIMLKFLFKSIHIKCNVSFSTVIFAPFLGGFFLALIIVVNDKSSFFKADFEFYNT